MSYLLLSYIAADSTDPENSLTTIIISTPPATREMKKE